MENKDVIEIKKEHVVNCTVIGKSSYHLRKKRKDGTYVITGFHFGTIKAKFILYLNPGEFYMIDKVKTRDHKGVFEDEKQAKDSFFYANCTRIVDEEVKIIEPK